MDFNKLIGKRIYLSEPQLVIESDAFEIPIKVETINDAENMAAVIINSRHVVSYNWILKLMELI